MGRERQKRYGHGRWARRQLYAIVASYRSMGRTPEWVAAKIGVGPTIVKEAFDYFDACEIHSGGEPDLGYWLDRRN